MLLVLFNCVYILFLILEMSEKEELSRLRKSHKVNIRYMESLKIEIQTLLHIFDIKIIENRDKLCAYKTKY